MVERKRRIWELQHSTVCRILGLTYNGDVLKELYKDLKLEHEHNGCMDAYEMHQHLIQLCRTQSQHARRLERLLEKRFAPYKEVARLDREEICRIIEGDGKMGSNNNVNLKEVPLSALIWFAVRNGNGDGNGGDGNSGREIESRIANALHLKEHQALRFYDELSRGSGIKPELVTKELHAALEAREKLQRRCERLEQKRDELIAEREKLRAEKTELVHELEELRRMNEQLQARMHEAEGEATDRELEETKNELSILRKELRRLSKENAELLKRSACHPGLKAEQRNIEQKERTHTRDCSECNANANANANKNKNNELRGLRVAYIGGVESLKLCYKEIVESFGCMFCYHGGHCMRGKKEIEGIVEKNDVIFCPVDINSHNACRMVKEACKMRNKPCYFLRSSGLSALKKVMSGFEPGYGKIYGG